jgi:hypothetical protein
MSRNRKSQYESDAGRLFEIVTGIILLGPALLLLCSGIGLAIEMLTDPSLALLAAMLIVLGWPLLIVSARLISGRGRADGGLFPPAVIVGGAVGIGLGSLGMAVYGAMNRDFVMAFASLTVLPAPYYAWRVVSRRKNRSGTGDQA